MFFSYISKNLNWEILTENLVTFKRWDGAKHEKILISWRFREKFDGARGGGWVTKNQYIGGNCLKRGAWTVCGFKMDLAKMRERVFFEGTGGLIPQCTLCS